MGRGVNGEGGGKGKEVGMGRQGVVRRDTEGAKVGWKMLFNDTWSQYRYSVSCITILFMNLQMGRREGFTK